MRVLIVEDEKGMAELLKKGLEEENHGVTLAFDCRQALEFADLYEFDAIVLDVMLLFVDGFDVARLELKRRRYTLRKRIFCPKNGEHLIGRASYDCNCMPVLCQVARPGLRATGYGVFNFVGTFAGGAIAAAAGAMKSSLSLGGMMEVVGALLFVAAVLLVRLDLPAVGSTECEV